MLRNKKTLRLCISIFIVMMVLVGCSPSNETNANKISTNVANKINKNMDNSIPDKVSDVDGSVSNEEIPKYKGKAYTILNNNVPRFKDSELKVDSYEYYGELDSLGRCTAAKANIGKDLMPNSEREPIGNVKPSGWHTIKYDCVDGKYLYNRCHLIGFQLTGENANNKNLITGTRYMNVEGMLPFEDMVADYIKETNNHVLYSVTPIFEGDNLVASGVQMEAKSVEDKGEGICFNVFVFNIQPGVTIDYATGQSYLSGTKQEVVTDIPENITNNELKDVENTYILNISTKKYHKTECSSVDAIKSHNKETYKGDISKLVKQGYEACKNCH